MEAPSDADRLQAFAPVQEMMTYVQFANDECDYGMGLELGLDLFCHGSHVSEHPPTHTHAWVWTQLEFQNELFEIILSISPQGQGSSCISIP